MASVSVPQAVLVGSSLVNGPVLACMFGPLAGLFLLGSLGVLGDAAVLLLAFPAFVAGTVLGWLWWSLAVPRWRLWAYERVDDIAALKRSALQAGLVWPDGHFFGRTEIKSRRMRQRERELEARAAATAVPETAF